MKIKYPIEIDAYSFAIRIPYECETDFLDFVFQSFSHRSVVESYKKAFKNRPDLYPPLLEEQ